MAVTKTLRDSNVTALCRDSSLEGAEVKRSGLSAALSPLLIAQLAHGDLSNATAQRGKAGGREEVAAQGQPWGVRDRGRGPRAARQGHCGEGGDCCFPGWDSDPEQWAEEQPGCQSPRSRVASHVVCCVLLDDAPNPVLKQGFLTHLWHRCHPHAVSVPGFAHLSVAGTNT